jgi:predicted DNA-binding ribbon-helix-helix protein
MTQVESSAAPAWEQRILQLAGRRYSLRLEPVFWEALAAIAERRRMRLNRLVAELAEHRGGEESLASHLRSFCLLEHRRAALARATPVERTSLMSLVESAPAPGALLDAAQRILTVNEAFAAWLGRPRRALDGEPLLRHFRLRGERPFEALWAGLGREWHLPEPQRIINIEPGRVLAANARLVPLVSGRGRPYCLLWLLR